MTTYTWTDNAMQGGTACDVDKVNDNLMYLKYNHFGTFNPLGTISGNFTLTANTITTGDINGDHSLTLPTVTDTANQVICVFDFTTTNASYPSITNTNLKWSNKNGGKAPSSYSTLSGVRNVLTFKSIWVSGSLYWETEYTTYGGVETSFVQPVLSSNGTLGGSSFAVYTDAALYSGHEPWYGSDGNNSTYFEMVFVAGKCHIWYNPNPLKVSYITILNSPSGNVTTTGYSIYGSNDNSTYTFLTTNSNNVTAGNATWYATIPENVQGYYKYYKMVFNTVGNTYVCWMEATLNGVYIST